MAKRKSQDSAVQAAEGNSEQNSFEGSTKPHDETLEVVKDKDDVKSVQANTHAKARTKKSIPINKQKNWIKFTGIAVGSLALIAILAAGLLGQFYKNRIMPNVYVAGVKSSEKTSEQVEQTLKGQLSNVKISFKTDNKILEPTLEDIGYQTNIKKTIENAKQAKRNNGLLDKLIFWKRVDVPASVSVNDNLLNQYLETNIPEISKAPVDAQLQFSAQKGEFVLTDAEDGQGADSVSIKRQVQKNAYELTPLTIQVGTTKKPAKITEQMLRPLVKPANDLVGQKIVLTGLGYTYQARPADIATWLTPTPQEDGSVKLIIDTAKIQSYVDGISKRISSIPVDRKVLRDESTGAEIVIQEGRDGTELAGKETLSSAIADALKNRTGTTQIMNIQTASYKTVNMNAFEKWIEVDLSEQRTTAYERTTPIKSFIIASGTKGHETVTGEFAIWHKNRKQTMQGGSKADGSYYSIPNVEWVSYFYKDYALHGAWWREKFGYPASHGCVNMTNADAQWIYEWAPIGTKVIVHP